ncbi:hypothetical protein HKD37_09G024301 [Glycine soja]
MEEDQWMHDNVMFEEVDVNEANGEEPGVHQHVDSFDAFNIFQDEKIIIVDMTKSMVKPRNILQTLKEHNVNSYTTIKQVYNAKNIYRSYIRDNNTEMQQLIKLHERDQYIHWHRLKDEDVIHSTYKTNRYRLSLLDMVSVTSTGMTFSTAFAYLEGKHLNNVVWTLEQDLALMNVVNTIFLESANLLCQFHIDKNVKAKCKTLIESLVDCPSDQQFDECHMKFEIVWWIVLLINRCSYRWFCHSRRSDRLLRRI